MNRTVVIEYLEVGEQTSRLVSVAADRFFDADGVPEFAHVHDYLRIEPARLCWTLLEVAGGAPGFRIRTQYFAHGAGWMTHRSDADGSEELIHVIRPSEGTELIVKTTKPASREWMVIAAVRLDGREQSDLLGLLAHYSGSSLLPADASGSFATVTHPEQARLGPWPSTG